MMALPRKAGQFRKLTPEEAAFHRRMRVSARKFERTRVVNGVEDRRLRSHLLSIDTDHFTKMLDIRTETTSLRAEIRANKFHRLQDKANAYDRMNREANKTQIWRYNSIGTEETEGSEQGRKVSFQGGNAPGLPGRRRSSSASVAQFRRPTSSRVQSATNLADSGDLAQKPLNGDASVTEHTSEAEGGNPDNGDTEKPEDYSYETQPIRNYQPPSSATYHSLRCPNSQYTTLKKTQNAIEESRRSLSRRPRPKCKSARMSWEKEAPDDADTLLEKKQIGQLVHFRAAQERKVLNDIVKKSVSRFLGHGSAPSHIVLPSVNNDSQGVLWNYLESHAYEPPSRSQTPEGSKTANIWNLKGTARRLKSAYVRKTGKSRA